MSTSFTLREWWAHLERARRVEVAAVVVLLVVIVGGAGALIGRQTSDRTPAEEVAREVNLAPCAVFPVPLAERIVGGPVERFDLTDLLPAEATTDQRSEAAAAAAKTCTYVPQGQELGEDNVVGFQLDRNLFASRADFMQANDQDGSAERVTDIGDAALISQSENGGWALAVLLDDGYSFAFGVADELASRDEVIDVGREIAAAFSA